MTGTAISPIAQANINPNIHNQVMHVQAQTRTAALAAPNPSAAAAINSAGALAAMNTMTAHTNAVSAENQARLGAAIVSSNLSSARLGSTANMAGMGIFAPGGTTYAQAMAARSAPVTTFSSFGMANVGFDGGAGMIGGGFGGGYRSISYGNMNNPFGNLALGVFNGWGGGRTVTFNAPQMGFGNFGAQTGVLTPFSNYGAGSVSPVQMIGSNALNPWSVTQARIGANFNSAANTAISNAIPTSRFTYNNIGESRGYDMGLPMGTATTALNQFNQRQQSLASLGNSISAAERNAQAIRNETVLNQGLKQAQSIQNLGDSRLSQMRDPRFDNFTYETGTTPNLMIEQQILNQGALGTTPNLWNDQARATGRDHLQKNFTW